MSRRTLTRRSFLATAPFACGGIWGVGQALSQDSRSANEGREFALSDAVKLPKPPGRVREVMGITPQQDRVLVVVSGNSDVLTLGTLPLSERGTFDTWFSLGTSCLRVFSAAWSPSGEATAIVAARFRDPVSSIFRTSLLTVTKGRETAPRHVLTEERNPRSKGGMQLEVSWVRKDVVCLSWRDLPWIEALDLARGKTRRVYKTESMPTVVCPMRRSGQSGVEFIESVLDTIVHPLEHRPSLVQLGLNSGTVERQLLAPGRGIWMGPLLSDATYVYSAHDMHMQLHSVRVFARQTNRLLYRIPIKMPGCVEEDDFLIPSAISADGRLLVCASGHVIDTTKDEFSPDLVLFTLGLA